MKYTIIYEISYKISNNEWVRVGINKEFDSENTSPDHEFIRVKDKCEVWMTQAVRQADQKKSKEVK